LPTGNGNNLRSHAIPKARDLSRSGKPCSDNSNSNWGRFHSLKKVAQKYLACFVTKITTLPDLNKATIWLRTSVDQRIDGAQSFTL